MGGPAARVTEYIDSRARRRLTDWEVLETIAAAALSTRSEPGPLLPAAHKPARTQQLEGAPSCAMPREEPTAVRAPPQPVTQPVSGGRGPRPCPWAPGPCWLFVVSLSSFQHWVQGLHTTSRKGLRA